MLIADVHAAYYIAFIKVIVINKVKFAITVTAVKCFRKKKKKAIH